MPETKLVKQETKMFDPIWLNTPTGAVTIRGHELISKQILNIIGACLNSPEFSEEHHGVFSMVFTTESVKSGEDEEVYAMFFPEPKSIVINLHKMWDNAMTEALSEKYSITEAVTENGQISVVCALHHNLLFHIFHDIHHAASYAGGVDIYNLSEQEHSKADRWAEEKIIELAKIIDIEPDWKSEPFFAPLIKETFLDLQDDEKDLVLINAKKLIEDGIFVHVQEKDDSMDITSFRNYVKLLTEDEENWEEKLLKKDFLSETKPNITPPIITTQPMVEEIPDDLPWEKGEGILFGGSPIATTGSPETLIPGTFNNAPNQQPITTPAPLPLFPQTTPLTLTSYPNNNIDINTVPDIMAQVFMACYQHIFGNCGLLVNSDMPFQVPEFVTQQPIDLNQIQGATAIVVAADINDAQGNWIPERQIENGQLFGNLKKTSKLPGYTLHLNVNGEHHVRALIPQNPNTNSKSAFRARAGNMLMWIIDNAATRDDKNRWKFIIDNGVITPCTPQYASA